MREKVQKRRVITVEGNKGHLPPALPTIGPCKPARLEGWECLRCEAHSKAVRCRSPLGTAGTHSTAPPGYSPRPCRYRTQIAQRLHTTDKDLPIPVPLPHTTDTPCVSSLLIPAPSLPARTQISSHKLPPLTLGSGYP